MTHTLTETKSTRKTTYGIKGDKINLIALHDQVAIVQNAKGQKFSVRLELIEEIKKEVHGNQL